MLRLIIVFSDSEIFVQREDVKYPAKWVSTLSDMQKDIAVLRVENAPFEPLKAEPTLRYYNDRLAVVIWGYPVESINNFPGMDMRSELNRVILRFRLEGKEEIKGSKEWNQKPEVILNVYRIPGKFDVGFGGAPVCNDKTTKYLECLLQKTKKMAMLYL